MKKYLTLIIALAFIVGCGQKKDEKKDQVTISNNYIEQGMNYLAETDLPRAIKSFDMAIKSDPMNPKNYIILGQVYMRLKNITGAIDSFSAALKVAPGNGEAYFLLATAKKLSGDKEGAIEAAQKSVEIYMRNRDEERFKSAVVLLKSLVEESSTQVEAASTE